MQRFGGVQTGLLPLGGTRDECDSGRSDPVFFVLASRRMAVTAAELLVLVRAEGVEQTAASLLGLGESTSAAALGFGALAIAGAATIGALGAATAEAANFQRSTMEIANNTTMATGQIDTMRQTILALGADSGVSFDTLGQGFMKAMNITNDTAASMAILTVATESAVSTGGNAAATTNVLANAMHEYGLDVVRAADGTLNLAAVQENAAHVMGVMHLAAASGNMTLEDYSNYSGRAIGIAANLGVSLEDVSAGFSSLTRHGFDAATAGTQMTNILTHLINPTKSAHSELVKLSHATGIDLVGDFTAAGLSSKGLEGVLGDLKTAYEKMGYSSADAEAESMKLIAAQRGGLGLATLLGTGYEDFTKTLADLNNQELTNGITEQSYNKIKETAGFQWDRLKRTVQEAAIVLGTAMLPALTGVLSGLQAAVAGALPFINTYGPILAAAIGTGLTAILNFGRGVASAIGAVIEAFRSLFAGTTNFGQFVGGIEIMVGTILGKLGELAARAAPYIGQFFSAIGSAINTYGPQIVAQFQIWGGRFSEWIQTTAIPFLVPRLQAFGTAITSWITGTALPAILAATQSLGQALADWVKTKAIPFLQANLPVWLTALSTWITGTALPAIGTAAESLGKALADWITTKAIPFLRANLPVWLTAITSWITGTALPAIGTAAESLGKALADWVKTKAIPALEANLPGIATAIATGLATALTNIDKFSTDAGVKLNAWIKTPETQTKIKEWNTGIGSSLDGVSTTVTNWGVELHFKIGDKFSEIGTTIRDRVTQYKNDTGEQFSQMGTVVRHKLTDMKNGVGDKFSDMGTDIHDKLTDIKNAVGDRFSDIGTAVRNKLTDLKKMVGDIFDTIGTTIHDKLDVVRDAIVGVWDKIPAPIRDDLNAIKDDIEKIWSGIGILIQQKLDAILTSVTTAWGNVVTAITGKTADAQKDVDDKFTNMATTVDTKTASMSTSATTNLTAMNTGMETNLNTMAESVATKFDAMVTAVDTNLTAMNTAMETKLDSMASTAQTKFDAIGSAIKTAMEPLVGFIDEKLTAMNTAMETNLNGMAETARAKFDAIVTAIRTKLGEAVRAVEGFAGQFRSAGVTIIEALGAGIESAMAAAISKVRAGLDKIAGMLPHSEPKDPNSPLRGLVQSGASVFAMFGAGIAQGAPAAVAAASAAAAGVNDAVVGFFEIASPSKKTHAHGRAVAQGLTNGIASATPAAAKAAADLAVAVSKGITDTLAAMHLLSTYDFATGSPTGGQFAALGTLTAQMVATIQDAAKGFGDAGLKAATTFADAAAKVGTMVKSALTGLQDLASYDFSKGTPTAQQMGMLTTLTVSLVQTIQDAATQFNDIGLKSATLFAEAAGKVGGMVKNALTGLADLAAFDFAKNTPTGSAMGLFRQLVADMVTNIQEAATAFSVDGLKQATAFSDAATKVMGLIVAGVGAFEKLATFVAPPAAAIYAFGKALRAALNDLALVAEQVTQDAAASAAKFAESASKVVSLLGTGVAAFEKLTTFQAVPLAAVYAFGKALRATINDFALLAEQITPDATKAAALFAEGAGKVVGIIGAGVDGFTKLADFAAPASSAISAFGKTLRAVINDLALVAEQVTQQATDSAAKFASGATTVLGVFGNGIAGLMDLAKFVAPSQKAIDDFAYAVGHLVERFANAARMIGEQGVAEAGKFGTAAKLAVDTIKVGLEAFALFKHMVVPSAEAIDTLVAGVAYVVGRFRDMADQMGGEALRKAQAFGTAVENTAKSIQTAIGTFKSLTEPPFKGAMTKIMTEFNGDFDGSLAMMIEAHGKAAQFETEARMYKEAMLNAATSIAAGNAALANAALPGNSLGRDMKTAGANLGDSLATGVRDALQIKSPSQVMVAVGQQVVAGLVGGMSSTQQDAVKKAAELAKAVADAVIATLTSLRALGNLNSAALPSGDQVGGFLGSTMQVVNAVATAASAMNGKALDAAVKFAEGAGKVLGFVGSGVDALAKLATAVLPSTTAIYGLGKLIQATVNDFAVMAEAVGTEMLGSAADFASGAGAVAEAVGKAVDGLTKLASYVDPAPAAIYALGKTLRLAIQDFAALAALVGKDMLAEAGALADGAGKVADTVGKGVAGLGKLVDYVDPPAAAVYALGKTIRLLVADFAAIADLLGNDASASAGRFADSAGKVVGIIGNAVDGFTKLADYKGIANGLIGPFVESVRTLVAAIGQAAAQFTTEGLTLAGQFADAAAKGVGILSNGVDGFMKLATYKGVGDAAIGAFVATVTTLVRGIGAASVAFTSDGLKLSGAFADAASKAVGILGAGVTGFASLATFVGPTQATMDAFLATVRYTVARFGEMATILDADGTKATTAFADAAAKSLGAVGAGVTAFKDMATLVLPVPATIDDLVNTIRYAVGQVAAAAKMFGGDTLAAATAFGTAASGVFAALKSGLDLFTALGKLNAPLTTAWLQPLVDLMGGVLTRSATLVTQAQQLKSDADRFAATLGQAFAGFTNAGGGLGAFGAGPALGFPVPSAAANGGGGGGGTTNVYVTITGNTMLADDPATADALARLLKPRLAQVGGY